MHDLATDTLFRICVWGPEQLFSDAPVYDRMLTLTELEDAGLSGLARRICELCGIEAPSR